MFLSSNGGLRRVNLLLIVLASPVSEKTKGGSSPLSPMLATPLSVCTVFPSVKYGEKKAIVSGGDSDSGSLSLSCTSKASSGKCQTWKLI